MRSATRSVVVARWVAVVLAAGATARAAAQGSGTGDSARAVPDSATKGLPIGAFAYTLLPDSSGDIKAAVNKTVAHMNFIVRPIARGRLMKVNPTPQRVHITLSHDTVSAAFDNGDPVITPLSGDTVPWTNALTHETDKAHAQASGDTVRQWIAAPDGERENAFIFVDGGARLRLHVTVKSHRLPQPLEYDLMFRRAD